MKSSPLHIPDLICIEPSIFKDDRGFFFESFNQRQFEDAVGLSVHFVQDNHSSSRHQVIRGLHYQLKHPQDKLIRVISGEIMDVAVDIRRSSPTFGESVSVMLSADNKKQLWIPKGFAHGFLVLSDHAEIIYKTTDYWVPGDEYCIAWNDPTLAIDWPIKASPVISVKDQQGVAFSSAELFDF